jgi:hypothetical protein
MTPGPEHLAAAVGRRGNEAVVRKLDVRATGAAYLGTRIRQEVGVLTYLLMQM